MLGLIRRPNKPSLDELCQKYNALAMTTCDCKNARGKAVKDIACSLADYLITNVMPNSLSLSYFQIPAQIIRAFTLHTGELMTSTNLQSFTLELIQDVAQVLKKGHIPDIQITDAYVVANNLPTQVSFNVTLHVDLTHNNTRYYQTISLSSNIN